VSDVSVGRRSAPAHLTRAIAPQLTVIGGQLAAGIGNLLFAVAMAHALAPGDYAQVVTFLALFVLLHVPGIALSAAGALDPERLARHRPRVVAAGVGVGVVLVTCCAPIGAAIGLTPSLVVALGVAAPAAALLSLHRGLAYGREQVGRVTASLVAEPVVRLAVGVSLALAAGPVGAAAATVLAGCAALAVCAARSEPDTRSPRRAAAPASSAIVLLAVSFVAIAVLQSTDLLVANRVLDADGAAAFGVLSTLGGAAFFATATIPLVLMPAAVRGREHAGQVAVALTAIVGLGVAVAGTVLAPIALPLAFGDRYGGLARLVGAYLLAMALLGVVRVQLARRAATAGQRAWPVVAVLVAIGAEGVADAMWARSVDAVVATTLFTTAGLAVVLELPYVLARADRAVVTARRSMGAVWSMVGLCAVATAVRTATSRGLWVDEAISVTQAQLPFGSMIRDMETTDVHPPLHHAILWVTVRLFGTSEFAVRLPSLIAGVALVPVMYWVGSVIYDRRTGWIAAVLTTIAPFCVWYSQEARMYAQFMLLAAVAVGAQVQAVRRGRWYDWGLYAVSTAALAWTQYFAILPILVQQVGFAWAIWQVRHRPRAWRSLLRGWIVTLVLIGLLVAPLLPIVRAEYAAYAHRGVGLVPSQAGAGSSTLGGTISIYSVGANLIWAFFGYHADSAMVQIAALWPLLMLLALVMLGRGRSRPSLLLLGLVVVPMTALFAFGSQRSDFFELRYFCGAVPAMLLLASRVLTATTIRRTAVVVTASVLTAVMAVGLVDQQLNGANPRLYDFKGAFAHIRAGAGKDDIVLYEPDYLAEVVSYYGPGMTSRVVGTKVPDGVRVWVMATEKVLAAKNSSAQLGTQLAHLEQHRRVVATYKLPNVTVWELEPA
jgi:O-antigen/teichoic acid export membrane protein